MYKYIKIVLVSILLLFQTHVVFAANLEGSTLGSSVIVPDSQLFIDGIKVENPEKIIEVSTNNPSFFGYTIPNVTIHLLIESNPIEGITTSDSKGYWIYNVEKPLPSGNHSLTLALRDYTNASSSPALAARFTISPQPNDIQQVPLIKEQSLNLSYITIPFIIFGVIAGLIAAYMVAKRYRHE